MEKGGLIWVRNSALRDKSIEDLWLPGEVVDIDISNPEEHKWTIICEDITRTVCLPSGVTETEDLKPRNTVVNVDMENLIDLSHLNEPEILMSLKVRFEKSLIFTYTGRVLLTINPRDMVTQSAECNRMMSQFVENIRNGVAEEIFSNPSSPSKHSILIGGESGSGKTETLKMILKAFRQHHAQDAEISSWFDKILVSNRVLESFGNARTVTTPNSSRFAKMIELFFNSAGDLVGSSIRTYLLESSRTSSQQYGERNFNLFYELLAGLSAEEQAALHIKPRQDYRYTTVGKIENELVEEEDRIEEKTKDARNFAEFKQNLEALGFEERAIRQLLQVVTAVLTLGDVEFQDDHSDNAGGCLVVRSDAAYQPVEIVAELLGIGVEALINLITRKDIATGRGEILYRRLSTAQAIIARDAVARAIYKNIFQWLGNAINAKLNQFRVDSDQGLKNSVMLLDIFGFDSFAMNSLEQLCINYANETLQQVFNYHVFKMERELYEREQIEFPEWSFLDNKSNIELIDGLVFKILDDQCRIPNPTDKRFVAQVYRDCGSHSRFAGNSAQERQNKFSINHYAGKVTYDGTNFIVTNTDNVPPTTGSVLIESTNELLVKICMGEDDAVVTSASPKVNTPRNGDKKKRRQSLIVGAGGSAAMRNPPSFVAQVKSDLALLSAEVEPTIPHYVRCIKPCEYRVDETEISSTNSAMDFSTSLSNAAVLRRSRSRDESNVLFQQWKVSEQLRYSGVLEAIGSLKVGFKTHLRHAEFYNKYHVIVSHLFLHPGLFPNRVDQSFTAEEVKNLCVALLDAFGSTAARLSGKFSLAKLIHLRAQSIHEVLDRCENGQGLIDSSRIKLGVTLAFVPRKEHETLEALRELTLRRCATLIQRQVRRFQAQNYLMKLKDAYVRLFRAARKFAAQIHLKHLRMRFRAVMSLQKIIRRRRLFQRVVKIQSLIRRYRARQAAQVLRDHRAELLVLYGPLITARAMRNRRRKDYEYYVSDNVPFALPSADARLKRYDEQEKTMINAIYDLITPAQIPTSVLYQHMDYRVLAHSITTFAATIKDAACKEKFDRLLAEMRRAEHMVKPSNLTRFTMVGKLFGPSMWRAFSNHAAQSEKLEVSLHENHSFFVRIVSIFPLIEEIKTLQTAAMASVRAECDELRQRNTPHADEKIIDLNARSTQLKRVNTTLDNLAMYYHKFVEHFLKEYGPNSQYRKKFSSDVEYTRGLIALAKQMKTFDGKMDLPDNSNVRVYNSNNCPLTVRWKDSSTTTSAEDAKDSLAVDHARSDVNHWLAKMAILQRQRASGLSRENLRILARNDIGYKYMPYAPGAEFAMNSLFALLRGQQITARRLVKLSDAKAEHVAYYQAMFRASDRSLLDVLYNPLLVEQVDTTSMTAAVLACCLAGLTNLQPNHLLVTMDKLNSLMPSEREKDSSRARDKAAAPRTASIERANKTKSLKTIRSARSVRNMRTISIKPGTDSDSIIRLLAFNNDAALSSPFLDFTNCARQHVHADNLNLLFLLPFMDEPVDPDVRKILTTTPFKAEEIVTSWLRDCYDQNQRFAKLKEAGFTARDLVALRVPIRLASGSAVELLHRLQRLCELLSLPHPQAEELMKQGKYQHHIKLHHVLREMYPQMAEFYAAVRQQNDFTKGLDISGVVSYALVYHETLERENAKAAEGGSACTSSESLPHTQQEAEPSHSHLALKKLHEALLVPNANPFANRASKHVESSAATTTAAAAAAVRDSSSLMGWKHDQDGEESEDISLSGASFSLDSISNDDTLHSVGGKDDHSRVSEKEPALREINGIALTDEDASHAESDAHSLRFSISNPSTPRALSVDGSSPARVLQTAQSLLSSPSSDSLTAEPEQQRDRDSTSELKDRVRALLDFDGEELDAQKKKKKRETLSMLCSDSENDSERDSLTESPLPRKKSSSHGGSGSGSSKRSPRSASAPSLLHTIQSCSTESERDFVETAVRLQQSAAVSPMSARSPLSARTHSIKFNFDNLYGSFRQEPQHNGGKSPLGVELRGVSSSMLRVVERKVAMHASPERIAPSHSSLSKSMSVDEGEEEVVINENDSLIDKLESATITTQQEQQEKENGQEEEEEPSQEDEAIVFEDNTMRRKAVVLQQENPLHSAQHQPAQDAPDAMKEEIEEKERHASSTQSTQTATNTTTAAAAAPNGPKQRAVPLEASVADEADALLKALDWRNFEPDDDDFSVSRAVEFCQAIGKNLSFLSELWLNYIADWQLKAMFNHWSQLLRENELPKSRVPLCVKKITLRYDSVEDMESMNNSPILVKLRRQFHIDVRFAIPTVISDFVQQQEEYKNRTSNKKKKNATQPQEEVEGANELEPSFDFDDLYRHASSDAQDEPMVALPPINANCSEFDIFEFQATSEAAEEEDEDDDSDTMRRQLLEVLDKCTSFPKDEPTNEAARALVHTMIVRMCTGPVQDIDDQLMSAFVRVLLRHPDVVPIAEVVADLGGFERSLSTVHTLLRSKHLERFCELIVRIVRQHPNVLWLSNDAGLLPCDVVKDLPESNAFKYKLLVRLVNLAGDLPVTYVKKYQNTENQGSVLTSFAGEEELIVRAAHYGIYASEDELRTKRFDETKRGFDSSASVDAVQSGAAAMDEDLLWRLLIFEAAGVPQQREYAWQTYSAFVKAMKSRLRGFPAGMPGSMSLQEIEDLIWNGLAWEHKSEARKNASFLSDTKVLQSSFIFKDLKAHWARGAAKKKAMAVALNAQATSSPSKA